MEGEDETPMMPLCGSNTGGDHSNTGGDHNNTGGDKRGDGRSKRKFSDAQVRSLECLFEAQTKLEPQTKAQLAGELGLQPRQVAVWFQNRRARWKSKQLETDYGALRADYDALLAGFESLKKEKQSLAAQLQKLAELLEKPVDQETNDDKCEDGDPSGWLPMEGSVDQKLQDCSIEGDLVIGYTGQQEARLCVSEPIISPSVPAERRCCFDTPGSLSDQSCGSPDWWELWPLN